MAGDVQFRTVVLSDSLVQTSSGYSVHYRHQPRRNDLSRPQRTDHDGFKESSREFTAPNETAPEPSEANNVRVQQSPGSSGRRNEVKDRER
jgi:hypothetical protein